jgi:hypothetical protein
MRPKIRELLGEVRQLEKVASDVAGKSHKAANEASGGLAQSYSVAGDVEHARNAANLSIQKAKQIKSLLIEVEKAVNESAPSTVLPVCFLELELAGFSKDFYLVENPILMTGFNLISPVSPLGAALLGKAPGEAFSYISGGQNFSGKVLEIG